MPCQLNLSQKFLPDLKLLSLNAQMLPRLQGLDGAQGQALCASPAQAQPAPHRTHLYQSFWGPGQLQENKRNTPDPLWKAAANSHLT